VRLTGCDLRCSYCDTEYAFNGGERLTIEDILSRVAGFRIPLVEVTGGEPLLQPEVHTLMRSLADKGMKVLLETSGAHDIGGCDPRVVRIVDLKTPSSGESGKNRWGNLPLLTATDEVKFVIGDRADFDWSAEVVREHHLVDLCTVLFSPVWKKLPLETLAEWIKESSLQVRLQPQLHKILYDDRRSV
jgi:7-carboxy-7-deazaguanine synthase